MDFSATFKATSSSVFSFDGTKLASIAGPRLCIRDVESLEMIKLHTCVDQIGAVAWSCDSRYVLCMLAARTVVQIFAVDSVSQVARIDEGSCGLIHACWTPDGRHVLTTCEFGLRLTIWNLLDQADIKQIKHPKLVNEGSAPLIAFTRDGKYMAYVERRECKDFVVIITLNDLVAVCRWELEGFTDTQTLDWSPEGHILCCADTSIGTYRVGFFTVNGRLCGQICPENALLGPRTIEWSHDSRLVAIGGLDGTIRLINHYTFGEFAVLSHPNPITSASVAVFKEEEIDEAPGVADPAAATSLRPCRYAVSPVPLSIPTRPTTSDTSKTRSGSVGSVAAAGVGGISTATFSNNDQFLATVEDSMPAVVWIWNVAKLSLEAVLIQLKPIRCVKWDPVRCRLGVATGSGRFYVWSPSGCTCIDTVAPNFSVRTFCWNPSGNSLVLEDKTTFCVAYPTFADG